MAPAVRSVRSETDGERAACAGGVERKAGPRRDGAGRRVEPLDREEREARQESGNARWRRATWRSADLNGVRPCEVRVVELCESEHER